MFTIPKMGAMKFASHLQWGTWILNYWYVFEPSAGHHENTRSRFVSSVSDHHLTSMPSRPALPGNQMLSCCSTTGIDIWRRLTPARGDLINHTGQFKWWQTAESPPLWWNGSPGMRRRQEVVVLRRWSEITEGVVPGTCNSILPTC